MQKHMTQENRMIGEKLPLGSLDQTESREELNSSIWTVIIERSTWIREIGA